MFLCVILFSLPPPPCQYKININAYTRVLWYAKLWLNVSHSRQTNQDRRNWPGHVHRVYIVRPPQCQAGRPAQRGSAPAGKGQARCNGVFAQRRWFAIRKDTSEIERESLKQSLPTRGTSSFSYKSGGGPSTCGVCRSNLDCM